MAKVFLGVGHGGVDPGAVSGGFKEKDLNLSIALSCSEELYRHGVIVLMSRTFDENDPIDQEVKECNAFQPDLAVDIHNNAGGGDGAEVFYFSGGGTSKTLAENILSEIVAIGQNSRGTKVKIGNGGKDYYAFIRDTYAPAALVECAFIDNAADVTIIDTEEERKAMGVAIAKGILKTLGIAFVPEVPSVSEPPAESLPEAKEEASDKTTETPEKEDSLEREPETKEEATEKNTSTPSLENSEEEIIFSDKEAQTFWKTILKALKSLLDWFFRKLD